MGSLQQIHACSFNEQEDFRETLANPKKKGDNNEPLCPLSLLGLVCRTAEPDNLPHDFRPLFRWPSSHPGRAVVCSFQSAGLDLEPRGRLVTNWKLLKRPNSIWRGGGLWDYPINKVTQRSVNLTSAPSTGARRRAVTSSGGSGVGGSGGYVALRHPGPN